MGVGAVYVRERGKGGERERGEREREGREGERGGRGRGGERELENFILQGL